jgi:hypothetical protein
MTVGTCMRLFLQSLRVALHNAKARMLRSRKSLVFPLSSAVNYQEQRAKLNLV